MKSLVVMLLAVMSAALAGCASGPTPQQRFDARVRQFGLPDYVSAPAGDGQWQMMPAKQAREGLADEPEQTFFYLDRNEQVLFQPGKPPERGPINPVARRALDPIPETNRKLREELPGIMKQAREAQRQQER